MEGHSTGRRGRSARTAGRLQPVAKNGAGASWDDQSVKHSARATESAMRLRAYVDRWSKCRQNPPFSPTPSESRHPSEGKPADPTVAGFHAPPKGALRIAARKSMCPLPHESGSSRITPGLVFGRGVLPDNAGES